MPYKSDAQRKFFHTDTAKKAGITESEVKEFDKASKGKELPEHAKKMAGGGTSDNPESSDFERGSNYPNSKITGMPPEVLGTLMSGLMGGMSPISAAKEVPSALEGLGEAGEVTLGRAAPAMEEAANPNEVTAFVKGIQKGAPGTEGVKIYGVKGAPERLKELFGDGAPGSVPEHILREKGILPAESISVPQVAPNAYAEGGKVERSSLAHPVPNGMMARAMNEGGYPHVTFLENESPAEVKKDTHMEGHKAGPMDTTETGEKENPKKMAKGGTIPKEDATHEDKMAKIYKAMGIKKYADGGTTSDAGDVDASQLPTPSPSDPTFWDQIKTGLSKLGNGPAGTIAGMAMNPVSGIANAAEGAAPSIMKAEAPIASGIASEITGGAIPSTAAPDVPPAPPTPPVIPPAAPPIAAAPAPSAANTAQAGMPNLGSLFNQDTSKLTEGVNPEDRQALANKLSDQRHGLGTIIAQAVSGIGDALAAKGGREQHSLQGIFAMEKQQRDEALANFDKARQDRVQKLALQTQMGDNALKQAAAVDAYGVDEHLNNMIGAPKGTMKKDLPTYFQLMSAQVAKQEKDADLYMKSHAQASTDVDNAVKNASVLGIKPSAAQLQASGSKLADQYFNRARGNVLVKPSDGGPAQWIPAQNLGKAKQMDPNLQVQP